MTLEINDLSPREGYKTLRKPQGAPSWYIYHHKKIEGPKSRQEILNLCPQRLGGPIWVSHHQLSGWHELHVIQQWLGSESLRHPPYEAPPDLVRKEPSPSDGFASQLTQATLSLNKPLLKDKPRLPPPKSPLLLALVLLPLSFGMIWPLWFYEQTAALKAHSKTPPAQDLKPLLLALLSLVPLIHLYPCYKLAQQTTKHEIAHGYRLCNPWLGLVMAFVPPLYLIYIQESLNQHAKLHQIKMGV